jgi:hypothetical protein
MQGHPLVDRRPSYSLTKNSGTLMIQILADSIAAEDMQVLSFHPGAVYGAVWEEQGLTEDMFPFDDREFNILQTPCFSEICRSITDSIL